MTVANVISNFYGLGTAATAATTNTTNFTQQWAPVYTDSVIPYDFVALGNQTGGPQVSLFDGNVRVPAVPSVYRDIPFSELDGHPDPDARLGEIYDELKAELEAVIRTHDRGARGMTTDQVWQRWVARPGSVVTDYTRGVERVTLDAVWSRWAESTPRHEGPVAVIPPRWRPPSPEERRRRTQEQRRNVLVSRNRQRSRTLRRRITERRARRLLFECLTQAQRDQYTEHDGFVVAVNSREYWIAIGHAGNVYLLDDRRRKVASYCIHAMMDLPDEDHMLAQKLLLETDEAMFLRIANRTGYAASRAIPGVTLPPTVPAYPRPVLAENVRSMVREAA